MTDPMDELRRNLQDTADAFRPDFDAAELATTSRRRRRNAGIAGGLAGAAVVAVALTVLVPTILRPNAPVLATPLPVPSASATQGLPAPSASSTDAITVPMDGWKHFASKEYPITFDYPADWTLEGLAGLTDGCTISGCAVTVQPPAGSGTAPVVLARNGFESSDNVTDGVHVQAEISASIPDLNGWADADSHPALPIVLARSGKNAEARDYYLALALTGANGSVGPSAFAVGTKNPLGARRDALISFGTSVDNLGGRVDREQDRAILMILASARPNPDYAPTLPITKNGKTFVAEFASMATPTLGAVTAGSDWATLRVEQAGIRLRYPDGWKLSHDAESQSWAITAPSGYQVKVGLAMDGNEYFARKTESELLGRLDQVSAKAAMELDFNETTAAASGPVEVRWVNGGEFAASAYLALSKGSREQDLLDFGNHRGVQVLGVGTTDNPTPDELDQVVAILASVQPLG